MAVYADLKHNQAQSSWLAVIAALLGTASTLQLTGELPSAITLIFLTFSTYAAYQAAVWRPRFSLNHFSFHFAKPPVKPYAHLIAVVWLILLFLLPARSRDSVIVLAILTLLYFVRWGPEGNERQGLRSVPLLKNVLLAGAWSVATVWLPLREDSWTIASVYLFLTRFIYIFTISLAFDLRDYNTDLKHNLKTLPVLIGFRNVQVVCSLLMILFISLLFYQQSFLAVPYRNSDELWWLTTSALITATGIIFFRKQMAAKYYTVFLDGNVGLQALIVVILRYCR